MCFIALALGRVVEEEEVRGVRVRADLKLEHVQTKDGQRRHKLLKKSRERKNSCSTNLQKSQSC
jgi:hypothetical protein